MTNQHPIGGYFELELTYRGTFPGEDCVLLNSGRNALEYILRSVQAIERLYLPYFTCDVVLEPINKLGIPIAWYHIDENLEISDEIVLGCDDYLLYTNYYGLKDLYCKHLSNKYKDHLILDNAQAYFSDRIIGVKTFYSPRKYVGIPDGGIAYCENGMGIRQFTKDQSWERCSHLLKRHDLIPSEGYQDFKENSKKLKGLDICQMSELTKAILHSIDFNEIKERRKKNYSILDKEFHSKNLLQLPFDKENNTPLIYPLWLENGSEVKKELAKQQIFCATYWPNVLEWCNPKDLEYQLADNIICIPIDQRYGEYDMKRIVDTILLTENEFKR